MALRAVLFTGAHCKGCPTMKANLKRADIAHDEIDIGTKDGAALASKLMVNALPSLFLFDEAVPIKSFPGVMPMAQLEKIKRKYF